MTRNPGAATLPEVIDRTLEPLIPSATARALVGVIDAGVVSIDGPHPRISACLDRVSLVDENLDTLPKGGELGPSDGHGTFVIGRILQETSDVQIMSRRGLDAEGFDADTMVATRLAAFTALDPSVRPQVVNLSFYGAETEPPEGIGHALLDLLDAAPDLVVVTSAGNRWTSVPPWPAAFHRDLLRHRDRLVAVGAVDTSIRWSPDLREPPRASFSNFWSGIQLWAPGVRVVGPYVRAKDDAYEFCTAVWSGTSFAAATVTGVLARGVQSGERAPDVLADLASHGPVVLAADTAWE
ncbi:S8/S53 family peptidase [Asanoa sp. NPDC049573]|uniref:S8/S53 family peptidase n=1 Tax=Asanoa sp. NPDC049573 TaxID=3155396 RepID=UPI00343E11E1